MILVTVYYVWVNEKNTIGELIEQELKNPVEKQWIEDSTLFTVDLVDVIKHSPLER